MASRLPSAGQYCRDETYIIVGLVDAVGASRYEHNNVCCCAIFLLPAASRECSSGYRKCPTTGRCINEDFFCDGDNDCGDMSDEDPDVCRKSQHPLMHTVAKMV